MNTWHIIACGRDEEVILSVVKKTTVDARRLAQGISTDCTEVTILVRNPDGETHWAYRHGMEVDL